MSIRIGIDISNKFSESTAPAIPPVLESAVIANAAPTDVVLTFDSRLSEAAIAASAFTLAGKTISSVTISEQTVTLVVSVAYAFGNVVTVDYTAPETNPLTALVGGGLVENFSGEVVTNNVQPDADAKALIDAMIAAGETPDATRQLLLNTTIITAKTKEFWNKLDALYCIASHGELSARLNWKQRAYDCTKIGAGAATFETDRGVTFDGLTSCFDTNFNPSTANGKYTNLSASLGVYTRTNFNEDTADIAINVSVTSGSWIKSRAGTALQWKLNGANNDAALVANSVGFSLVTLDPVTSKMPVYRNGVLQANNAGSPTGLQNANVYIGAARNVYFSNRQIAIGLIGEWFSQTDVNDFISVFIDGYLNTIGAKV